MKFLNSRGFSSLISELTRVSGDIEFESSLEIRGTVTGKIIHSGDGKSAITIAKGASVETILLKASNMMINGKISCEEIWSEEFLQIGSDANIKGGTIYYRNLQISTGAVLEGCTFHHIDYVSKSELT